MKSMIDSCELYDLDNAVIDTLARAGIRPTEPMVSFRYGYFSSWNNYGPLFECQNKGKSFTLVPAFTPNNFWDGTTSAPTSSGTIYFQWRGETADEIGNLFLGYDSMQMEGRFQYDWDLTAEIHEELEFDRHRNNQGKLETKTLNGKVVGFKASGIAEDQVRQYANLVTALYIEEAVKVLARDIGEIKF